MPHHKESKTIRKNQRGMPTAANARFCAFSKKAFKTRMGRGIVHENQTVDQPGGWPINRIGASIGSC
jgi:hypothetical protein